MAFPTKVCVACGEEFELKPDKPGFANRCSDCSALEEASSPVNQRKMDADFQRCIKQSSLAFWDAYLKNDNAGREYLDKLRLRGDVQVESK